MMDKIAQLLQIDQSTIWHPYSAMDSALPCYPVKSAKGVRLTLADGRELIDGMASWWSVIHGYNHPEINHALVTQLESMAHVMFGGLTHAPAIELAAQLKAITPAPLQTVFYSDSGSVAVEVALKMAIQYWQAKGQPRRQHFISLRSAYHGDTMGAMSVCDPVTGMHRLFSEVLPKQFFIPQPQSRFGAPCAADDIAPLEQLLAQQGDNIAALIIEPIVQGAGGMWFYAKEYLTQARALCDEYETLLIFDEIATGFGRTGALFAGDHANVSPDILCVGKALTGGYLSLAATLTTTAVAETIDRGEPGVFMHGPTFMGNALACTAALTSIRLLLDSAWQDNIKRIERELKQALAPCRQFAAVHDVRILGAIGVVELNSPVDMAWMVPKFVDSGVWIRPFGKLVYIMPPYIISNAELHQLATAIIKILAQLEK